MYGGRVCGCVMGVCACVFGYVDSQGQLASSIHIHSYRVYFHWEMVTVMKCV